MTFLIEAVELGGLDPIKLVITGDSRCQYWWPSVDKVLVKLDMYLSQTIRKQARKNGKQSVPNMRYLKAA